MDGLPELCAQAFDFVSKGKPRFSFADRETAWMWVFRASLTKRGVNSMKKTTLIFISVGMFAGTALAGPQWGAPPVTVPGVSNGKVPGAGIKLQCNLSGTWMTDLDWKRKHSDSVSFVISPQVDVRKMPGMYRVASQADPSISVPLGVAQKTARGNLSVSGYDVSVLFAERFGNALKVGYITGTVDRACKTIQGTIISSNTHANISRPITLHRSDVVKINYDKWK